METTITKFITSMNAFDVEVALTLFSAKAVIDERSVGKKFKGKSGLREYFEEYFVGYHTVTQLDAIEIIDTTHANAHVDFTGDFGHEKGMLNFAFNKDGLITGVEADLL
ncbi:nuclear transport factor 2 family protein [Aestuariivirga litoralis]|uniref:nuclear transport factor 2 family protein n=1 Tax=Aestuariivirga litoralis TaxID=2650924 RepID=UPI0018C68D4E|nr:nuclear transport factor 2 family protein [Aestuariivirga litoralis]MBG1232807.1 nuclear transport factor 2 family protein [Aestuariivirga litoralis]